MKPSKLSYEEHHAHLEVEMHRIIHELECLIERDREYQDSMQRHYLWKALHKLRDGVDWYDYFRKRAKVS